MHLLSTLARWLFGRLALLLLVLAVLRRGRDAWHRRGAAAADRRRAERSVLPSLYDLHPEASSAVPRRVGLQSVPLDRIVGTLRRPSQNTADFLPLPQLRGRNWAARWRRILAANDNLAILPPVELSKVDDDYFVADGHNRVAAARLADAAEIDADVTELLVPGRTPQRRSGSIATALIGGEQLRQAGLGRHSRTVESRTTADAISRRDLARQTDPEAAPDADDERNP